MLDTWEGGLGHECPIMETSPIMVDWDRGSSCWARGWEVLESGCSTMETSSIVVDWDNGSACWTLGRRVWDMNVPPWRNQPYNGRLG